MQFFTPQLYQQFNSPDEAEAERANEAWEEAIVAYKRHLDAIRDRMTPQVVALSELCLHDAEVLAREEIIQGGIGPAFYDFPMPLPIWSATAVITVRLDGEIVSLFYSLWDRVRTHEAPQTWTFSKLREHWLYDEIHALPERRVAAYVHRILLSTGVVLEIPFLTVVVHGFRVPHAAEAAAKQSA